MVLKRRRVGPSSARGAVAELLPLLLLAACGGAEADVAKETPLPVRAAESRSVEGSARVDGTGTAAFEREAVLSFRVAGVLRALSVDVGDRFERGGDLPPRLRVVTAGAGYLKHGDVVTVAGDAGL